MANVPGQVKPNAAGGSDGGGRGRRSLADRVAPVAAAPVTSTFTNLTWLKIAVLGALMVALHFKLLHAAVKTWIGNPNWTHGFIIPLFSLYLLYARRDDLLTVPRRTTPLTAILGLGLMILSMAAEVIAIFQIRNHWLAQNAMVGMLLGLVLYLGGWRVIRLTWLPILFLIFALPIPTIEYERAAMPLQNIAAKGAVAILRLLGVVIESTASNLRLISQSKQEHALTVAEACSGMRLLMAFLALGVAMAYLDYKPIWQRAILVAMAIPIAVFCNVLRVAITCWMYYIDKSELGQEFMHYFTGMLMLVPAFLLLWLLAWILRHLFIEEETDEGEVKEAAA